MAKYNTDLQQNNTELDRILETVNSLPDAGGPAAEGKWELIETITPAAEVNKIARYTEPDGTPYNFKKLKFIFKSASGRPAADNAQRIVVFASSPEAEYIQADEEAEGMLQDSRWYGVLICDNGYLKYEGVLPTQGFYAEGRPKFQSPYYMETQGEASAIKSFGLQAAAGKTIPVDTSIIIKAVRA